MTIEEARNASTEYFRERFSACPPVSRRVLGSCVTSCPGGAGAFSEDPSPWSSVWRFARASELSAASTRSICTGPEVCGAGSVEPDARTLAPGVPGRRST